jgi:hypothetical protein
MPQLIYPPVKESPAPSEVEAGWVPSVGLDALEIEQFLTPAKSRTPPHIRVITLTQLLFEAVVQSVF